MYREVVDFDIFSAEGQPTLPFALKFGRTVAGAHRFAVADEEGTIALFELSASDASAHTLRCRWDAHSNAIFDVAWLDDDRQLISASGDQTFRLWDVQTAQTLAVAKGHTGSIKSVAAREDEAHLVATGGRDGQIMLWDMRAGTLERALSPVVRIAQAHDPNRTWGRRKRARAESHKSVTAVHFLPWDHALASAGASDGCVATVVRAALLMSALGSICASAHACLPTCPPALPRGPDSHRAAALLARVRPLAHSKIKIWDLRSSGSPACHIDAAASAGTPPTDGGRARGFCCLDVDRANLRLLGGTTGGKVYLYDLMRPTLGATHTLEGHSSETFYVKAVFSPDGRHVASGSSDKLGYVWDVERPSAPPVQLAGHAGEVTTLDFCHAQDESLAMSLASCSDDGTVRVWARDRLPAERTFITPERATRRGSRPVTVPHSEGGGVAGSAQSADAAASASRTAPAPLVRVRTIEDFWRQPSPAQRSAPSPSPREGG